MLCAAIMTENWEHVSWERAALAALANTSNTALQWLLDEKVVKVKHLLLLSHYVLLLALCLPNTLPW